MKIKRFVSIVLAVIMIATALPVAFAAETNTVIIYTNDVHCAIDDYAVLAAYRAELIAQGNTVITVDAGDAIQGEVIGMLTEGEAVVDIMNAAGYDLAVPGNHEFDYGVERFLELAENEAEYEYISSNFCDLTPNNSPVFNPYSIKDGENGEKIAFVGISTPETFTKTSPEYFKDKNGNFIYGFPTSPAGMTGEKLYENVQDSVDAAIAEGADIVVAVGHLGIQETEEGWKSTDVIANTNGIDFVIDAHSHETIESAVYKNKDNEDVTLTSTGTKFANFGQLTIGADGSAEFERINPDSIDVETMSAAAKAAYNTVKTKVDGYNEEIAYLYDPIGTSEVDLVTYDENGNWLVRKSETNTGDFVADAYIEITDADIALVNGGGIRSEIEKGNVSRRDLMNVNPYGNEMCTVLLTGQQIVDALEHGARNYPESFGGFLQVSWSLSYEIDAYKESPVIVDEVGNFVRIDETKERRVKNVMFLDRPIELDHEYRVTGTKYLLQQGGDGYTMFAGAVGVDNNCTDSEMLIKYFTENLGGKITAEKYGNPEGDGRIIINDVDLVSICTHICHKDGFLGFLWAIAQFFCIIFGISPVCDCGMAHY